MAPVVLDVLRDHVRQAETLRHGGRRRHVTGGRHVAARVARALVVLQLSALAGRKPGIRKELVGPALIGILDTFSGQPLRHVQRSAGAAVMQNGKCLVTELPAAQRWWRCRRSATREELWALGEAGGLGREQRRTIEDRIVRSG